MAVLPKTVGELRRLLETFPDDLAIFVQGDTQENPNAHPNHFVVEHWEVPECDPPMLLLAGIPHIPEGSIKIKNMKDEEKFALVHDHTDADGEPLEYIAERNGIGHANEYSSNDPNASWNLPK